MTMQVGMLSFEHMHAFSYAAVIKELPDVELAAAWDEEPERLHKVETQFNIPVCSTSIDKVLSMPLDAVVICSRNSTHRTLVENAAGAKKHILCEKPIATTIEDAGAMIQACHKARVKFMSAFPCRFIPQIMRARDIYREESLGEVYAVRTTNHGMMPGGWFIQPELSGGGAVIDHTVHVIDLLRWITGLEVTEVYAEMDTLLNDIPCEDCGLLNFKLGDRIFGTLDTSWSRPRSFVTWGDVTLRFVGSEGILEADGFPRAFHIFDNNTKTSHTTLSGPDNPDREMMKEFIAAIREDREPMITGKDGMEALRVALAAYESAKTLKTVKLSHS